jgi:hypothetical protein
MELTNELHETHCQTSYMTLTCQRIRALIGARVNGQAHQNALHLSAAVGTASGHFDLFREFGEVNPEPDSQGQGVSHRRGDFDQRSEGLLSALGLSAYTIPHRRAQGIYRSVGADLLMTVKCLFATITDRVDSTD